MDASPGKRFREAMSVECPLQLVGAVNAYVAIMAKQAGFRALYLSGAGVANISYGLPDLGITTLDNVLEDVRRITDVVDLPLLVDIDTGWGHSLMVTRSIREMIHAGAAGVHIEDQAIHKRCGHRPNKTIVSRDEMIDRIQGAAEAKTDSDFIIMARSDAFAVEGLEGLIKRCKAYRDAGADMIFPEALQTLEQYKAVKEEVGLPIMANLTEFGLTPLFTLEQLRSAQVDIALYPMSVSRVMNHAAQHALNVIRQEGTQESLLPKMQTREELYHYLNYFAYEKDGG